MDKAEVYRDGKRQGSIEGRLLIAMTATPNGDDSMDGQCCTVGNYCADDALWALDKLISTVAGQLDMSIHEVLGLIWLKNSTDEEELADE